uniref:CARD domain-containing protein n=1 Tax=Takifugu rubripes TaxID=31033 RepID=A0A674NN78_TAKRU
MDAQFLCSDERMDTELVDKLVLQLNRTYPQILSDKEAHRFRNLSVATNVRLGELLKHLCGEGEEACEEFYRGLHLQAEDVYTSLPTRVLQRGKHSSLLNAGFVGQLSSRANTPFKPISSALHSFEQLMGETSRGSKVCHQNMGHP